MKSNYHTHTWRCNHASGTEKEYVQHAIQRGITTLGFSDHTPYIFTNGYRSRVRMLPEQLAGYCDCIQNLHQEFKDQIDIHIGLEAEYCPTYFTETLAFLKDHPVEYLILGQHFVKDEPGGTYTGSQTDDVSILKQYCYQCMDAIHTGLFTYIAHPDLINFTGSDELYHQYLSEMIREAVQCGVPLEMNLLGVAENRHYPSRRFLEIAAEENAPIILGCDAHYAEALSNTAFEETALSILREYNLTILEKIPLRHI